MTITAILALLVQVVGLLNALLTASNIPAAVQTQALDAARKGIEVATQHVAALPGPGLPGQSGPTTEPSARAATYTVSSQRPGPAVTKIVFDPDPLTVANEIMRIRVWANDQTGVTAAWVVIDADSSSSTVPLSRVAGNAAEGIWLGDWEGNVVVSRLTVYRTKIYAVNAAGERAEIVMNWTNN